MSSESILQHIQKTVSTSPAVIYSKSYCPYCNRAKKKLHDLKINYISVEVNLCENQQDIQNALYELTHQRTFPNIFINGVHIGGCDDLFNQLADGTISTILKSSKLIDT